MNRFITLAGALVLSAIAQAQVLEKPYAVPLQTAYRISGTYAELRLNHYHSGLDMGTAGVENVPVHAAEKGWVSRIKVGPYGYGKALYIDHPDGNTTVYGHLNGFAPKIDSLLRARQEAERNYNVEFYPAAGSPTVARGEVVAYSGNTGGSGGPHLHFEVRNTKTEEPLNPMRFIVVPPDPVPPAIYGLKLYSLDATSQVAGAAADKYYTAAQCAGKVLDVCGQIGVGIHCTDFPTAGGRPCGITEAKLYDGDSLLCHWRVEHYDFEQTRSVNSHFDYAEWVHHRRFIQKAFVSPGNRLPIYLRRGGAIEVDEGSTHKLRWELYDFAGNRSVLNVTLRGRRNAATPQRATPQGTLVRRDQYWDIDTLGLGLEMEPATLYDDTYIRIRSGGQYSGQRAVTVGDGATPLDKPVRVTMPVPKMWQSRGRQVCLLLAGSRPTYLGGEMRADSQLQAGPMLITATTKTLGSFAVGIDSVPPTVAIRNKTAQLRASTEIVLGVADNLSGIDHYDVYIDGVWHGFEFDYKRARLFATVARLGLARGRHHLQALVRDAAGNEQKLEWDFEN